MKKRVLAIVLSLTIVVAFMPTLAFATGDEGGGQQSSGSEVTGETGPLSINDMILNYIKGLNLEEIKASIDALTDAGKKVKEAYESGDSEKLAEAIEAYGHQLDTLFDQVDVIAEAVEGFQDNVQAQLKKMRDEAEAQVKKLQEKVNKSWGIAKAAYQKQLNKAKEVRDALKKLDEALQGQVSDLLKDINENLEKAADDFHNGLVDKINEMTDAVNNWGLEGKYNELMDKVEAFQDNLQGKIEDMNTAVEGFIKAVNSQLDTATGAVRDFFKGQLDKANDLLKALGELNTALNKQVKGLKNAIEQAISEDPVLEDLKAQIAELKDAIKGAPGNLYQELLDEINEMTDAVNAFDPEKAVAEIGAFHKGIHDKIVAMNTAVENFGKALEEKVKTAAGEAKEALDAQLAKVNALKTALKDLNDALEATVRDLDEAIKEAVVGSEWHQAAVATMKQLKEKLAALDEAIKAAPEELYNDLLDKITEMTEAVRDFDAYGAVAEAQARIEQFQTGLQEKVAEMQEAIKEFCETLQEKIETAAGEAKAVLEDQLEEAKKLKAVLDAFNEALADEIELVIDAIADAIEESGLPEKVEAMKAKLAAINEALMEKVDAMAEDFQNAMYDKFHVQIEKAVAVAKAAQEQIKVLIEKYENGEIDKETFAEMFAKLNNDVVKVAAKLKNIAMQLPTGAFVEAVKNLNEAIKAGLVKKGDAIKALVEELKALTAMAKEAVEAKISKATAKVIEEAKAAIEASMDIIMPYVMGQMSALVDKLEAGDFDKYLEPLGITGDQLVKIAENLIDALLSDKSVAEMQEEIEFLTIAQKELSDKLDTTTAENAALKEEVKKANKKADDVAAAFEKAWSNAKKLEAKKVTIKKAKYKKKKVTVTWKKFKGAKINGYQVSWKVGKKAWKSKTVKGASKTKAKTSKIKAKKNTKIKVKVRAYYTMKYKGKTQKFYSKWSKVKKVKVK
jgi:DNA repair exonuclease SbcCD ATPase subunit